MLHHFVRDIEIVGIFNEGPTWLAAAGITALGDIGLKVRNNTIGPVDSLQVYCLEKEVHGLDETPTRSTGGGGKHASIEAVRQ